MSLSTSNWYPDYKEAENSFLNWGLTRDKFLPWGQKKNLPEGHLDEVR